MLRLYLILGADAHEARDQKIVAEGCGRDLRKSRAKSAAGLQHGAARTQRGVIPRHEVAEFMYNSTLLRQQQQQQESDGFEKLFHLNDARTPGR